MILALQPVIFIEIEVRVVIFPKYVYQGRLAVFGLHLVERLVDEPYRNTVEVFGKVGLPAQTAAIAGFCHPVADFRNYLAAPYTGLVGLARRVQHLRHQLEEQVVGDTQYYAVHRLVYVHCAELTVVLGYLRRVGRGNLVLSPAHGIGHRHTGMLVGQPNKLVFPNVFQHAFLNGLRPPAYVEEHLQYLVFIHGTQNFFGKG